MRQFGEARTCRPCRSPTGHGAQATSCGRRDRRCQARFRPLGRSRLVMPSTPCNSYPGRHLGIHDPAGALPTHALRISQNTCVPNGEMASWQPGFWRQGAHSVSAWQRHRPGEEAFRTVRRPAPGTESQPLAGNDSRVGSTGNGLTCTGSAAGGGHDLSRQYRKKRIRKRSAEGGRGWRALRDSNSRPFGS